MKCITEKWNELICHKKIKYIAEDGTEFTDKVKCERYENFCLTQECLKQILSTEGVETCEQLKGYYSYNAILAHDYIEPMGFPIWIKITNTNALTRVKNLLSIFIQYGALNEINQWYCVLYPQTMYSECNSDNAIDTEDMCVEIYPVSDLIKTFIDHMDLLGLVVHKE